MNLSKFKSFSLILAIMALSAIIAACSGSSSSSGSTASTGVTINGTLGSSSKPLPISSKAAAKKVITFKATKKSKKASRKGTLAAQSVTLSDLQLYGLAFSDIPEAKQVDVGTDGSFSIAFSAAAAGKPITLIFRNKTSGSEVGVVKFTDSTKTDLNGDVKSQTSIALNEGTVSLGNLAINADGEVVVPMTQISAVVATPTVTATSELFDFSGSWILGQYDSNGDLSDIGKYAPICEEDEENCSGPKAGEKIFMERLVGQSFEPNDACKTDIADGTLSDTCEGTTGTTDVFAVRIWGSRTVRNACSNADNSTTTDRSVLGVTSNEAKAFGRIDFSSNTDLVKEAYHLSTSDGSEHTIADGWKLSNAKSSYGISRCINTTVTIASVQHPVFKCTDGAGKVNIQFQKSGCRNTSTSEPVQMSKSFNWQGGACAQAVVAGTDSDAHAFQRTGCSWTNKDHDGDAATPAINVTCSNISFVDVGFDWSSALIGAADTPCSEVYTTDNLAGLKCYAEAYWKSGLERNQNLCLAEVRMNWGATTAANFVEKQNGPPKIAAMHAFSNFDYAADGQSGAFSFSQKDYRQVQSGEKSWANCKLRKDFRMTIKKIDSTHLASEMTTVTVLLDSDKDACVAAAANGDTMLGVGSIKSMMILTKE